MTLACHRVNFVIKQQKNQVGLALLYALYWSGIYINLWDFTLIQACTFSSSGCYPHPAVPKHPGAIAVQREVVYCPDLKFIAYDIAITRPQAADRGW